MLFKCFFVPNVVSTCYKYMAKIPWALWPHHPLYLGLYFEDARWNGSRRPTLRQKYPDHFHCVIQQTLLPVRMGEWHWEEPEKSETATEKDLHVTYIQETNNWLGLPDKPGEASLWHLNETCTAGDLSAALCTVRGDEMHWPSPPSHRSSAWASFSMWTGKEPHGVPGILSAAFHNKKY